MVEKRTSNSKIIKTTTVRRRVTKPKPAMSLKHFKSTVNLMSPVDRLYLLTVLSRQNQNFKAPKKSKRLTIQKSKLSKIQTKNLKLKPVIPTANELLLRSFSL